MKNLSKNYRLRRNIGFVIIAVILIWAIFTFLVYPNLSLLRITLFPDGTFDVAPVIQILSSDRVLTALKNSFILAVSLTITVNILGIFQIFVLDYYEIKGNKWLNIAYHSPLICNGMVLVTAYNFIFGSQGFLTANLMELFPNMDPYWFRGFGAVLIEMTFAGTSNHIMFVRDSLKNIDYQTIEAAENMGVKGRRILTKVVLPVLKPSIFAASILTFIVGVSAFATPQVLGGEEFETINPLVRSFSRTLTTRNYAAVLALLLGIITILVLVITNHIEKKGNYVSISKVKTPLKKTKIQNPVLRWIVTVAAHIIALIQTVPLLFVFIFSFMTAGDLYAGEMNIKNFTLNNYLMVINSTTGLRPVLTSMVYSGLSAVLVVGFMLVIARIITKYNNKLTGTLELFLQIPWFLPVTLIALGLIMTFDRPNILTFGLTLTGTVYIMLIGYIIIRLPYTLRMIKAAYAGIDNSLEEAAKNLGASTVKTYIKVIFPIIWPEVLSVFLLNFIQQLSEYNVSVFLFHPMFQPLGVMLNVATGADSTPESQMMSFVYSVIIMVVSIVIISFVYGRKSATLKKRQ
ncbi:iron ABC transporter permease [Lachnoclostridium sp. An169]|uniref:ABC transporter permease n=1 Tax=Lachnoclostridium sp. An169 TaxID=1965569 RepID=UPI000B395B34|nr:iron ABC transporter permease [Lachnoclostridium sp. An169]OUP83656.1 iron ABC transporter permease [Lachnoclostridium sp. An169]